MLTAAASSDIGSGMGVVLASFGRSALVRTETDVRHCGFIGRRLRVVCGDRVAWRKAKPQEPALIERVEKRSSMLERIDNRGHPAVIAANVQRLAVVLAPQPKPDWFVIDRYLAGAQLRDIASMLIINKCDLGTTDIQAEVDVYRNLPLQCHEVSSRNPDSLGPLRASMQSGTILLVGQSGVGKSSIINALIPDAAAQTATLSRDAEGRHTTTTTRLYQLGQACALMDAPGVRDYAPPANIERAAERAFIEIHAAGAHCRFNDCRHFDEPNCAVRKGVADNSIAPRRYESYRRLLRLFETFSAN